MEHIHTHVLVSTQKTQIKLNCKLWKNSWYDNDQSSWIINQQTKRGMICRFAMPTDTVRYNELKDLSFSKTKGE